MAFALAAEIGSPRPRRRPACAALRRFALAFFSLALCGALGLAAGARAQAPAFLVADINAKAELTDVVALADVNGTLFFTADDGANGSELWMSDGAGPGTQPIVSGLSDLVTYSVIAAGDLLFFNAINNATGYEPWAFTADCCSSVPPGQGVGNTVLGGSGTPNGVDFNLDDTAGGVLTALSMPTPIADLAGVIRDPGTINFGLPNDPLPL